MNTTPTLTLLITASILLIASSAKAKTAEVGRAPLRIQKILNEGYAVRYSTYVKGVERISGTLVSINRKNSRGLSESEIEALFKGPIGSTVTITYIDNLNISHTVPVLRRKIAKGGSKPYQIGSVRYFPRNVSTNHGVIWGSNLHDQSRSYEDQNLDLLVRTNLILLMENCLELPKPNSLNVFKSAADAALMLDKIGDMDAADRYLETALANSKLPEKGKIRFGSRFDTKLIQHCIDTGRIDEMNRLYKTFNKLPKLSSTNIHSERRKRWKLKTQRIKFLESKDKNRALEIANELFELEKGNRIQRRFPEPKMSRLGNAFDRLGDHEKALECFRFAKPMENFKKAAPGKMRLEEVRNYSYSIIREAQILEKLHKNDQAITHLKELLAEYENRLSEEQKAIAEKMALYYPARSDIEFLLIKLYRASGQASKADNLKTDLDSLLEQTGNDITTLKRRERNSSNLDATNKTSEKFLLVRSILDAIKSDAKDKSQKDIEKLIGIYKNEDPVYSHDRRPLNTFSALVHIARRLADKERFRESEDLIVLLKESVIQKEKTPAALGFLKIEEALNSRSANPWSSVDKEATLAGYSYDYERRKQTPLKPEILAKLKALDSLRRYAYIYYSAGLLKRAEKMQKHALEIEKEIMSKVTHQNLDIQENRADLFFDIALVEAKLNNFEQSNNYFEKAISLLTPEVLGDNQNNRGQTFSSSYKNKSVRLADILFKKNKVESSRAILSKLTSKLENSNINDFKEEKDSRKKSDTLRIIKDNALVRYYIAKVDYELGNNENAYKNIKRAADDLYNNVPFMVSYLAAKIASSLNRFADAAHYYSECERSSSNIVSNRQLQPGYKLLLLEKSVACLSKAKNFDNIEKSNIYIRLGGLYRPKDKSKALQYYEKAIPLLPDKERRKAELATKIAWLKSSLVNNKISKKVYNREKISKEESNKLQIESAKQRVPALTQAALAADKSKRRNTWSYWSRLAQAEAKAQMPKKAIEHAKHSIETYRKPTDIVYFVPIIYGTHGIASDLLKQGYEADAETLIKSAIKKVKTEYGDESPAVLMQKAHLFIYYLKQNKDRLAMKELDQILKAGSTKLEIGRSYQNAESTIISWSAYLEKEGKGTLYLKILNKLLACQKRGLPPDHLRIAKTLEAVAKVEKGLKQYREAKETLQRTFEIKKLYVGKLRANTELSSILIPVLKKLGENEEAKQLAISKIDSRVNNWPKGYVDPRNYRWGRPDVGKDKLSLVVELDAARKQAPYSLRTQAALEALMGLACRNKDWDLLASTAAERIVVLEHHPTINAGRHFGCVPPRYNRTQYYILAAKANLNLGKAKEAKEWISRGIEKLPALKGYEWLRFAEFAYKMKDNSMAVSYLEEANKLTENNYSLYNHMADLWRRMGDREKSRLLQSMYQEAKVQSDISRKRYKNDPFRGAQ